MFGLRCAGTLLTPGIIDPSRNKSYAWSDLANDSGAVWTSQATCEKQSVMFRTQTQSPRLATLIWHRTAPLASLQQKKTEVFIGLTNEKRAIYIRGGKKKKDLEWARKKPTVLSRNLLNSYANKGHSKALWANKFYHSSMWQKYPYGHRCVASLESFKRD